MTTIAKQTRGRKHFNLTRHDIIDDNLQTTEQVYQHILFNILHLPQLYLEDNFESAKSNISMLIEILQTIENYTIVASSYIY